MKVSRKMDKSHGKQTLEKQTVVLVIKVIHESNLAVLRCLVNWKGTALLTAQFSRKKGKCISTNRYYIVSSLSF